MAEGKCCVLGLQSTGEARTTEIIAAKEQLEDFVSTAAGQRATKPKCIVANGITGKHYFNILFQRLLCTLFR